MKKRLLSIMTALALCLSLLPATALATTGSITYLDANGEEQTYTEEYTVVEDYTGTKTVTWGTADVTTWYVVNRDVTISTTGGYAVKAYGDVHLILMDNCTLTTGPIANYGSLTIYAQSTEKDTMGELTATGRYSCAAIENGAAQSITINGGYIQATGGDGGDASSTDDNAGAAGIGGHGGSSTVAGSSGGTITINGGYIEARGGNGVNGFANSGGAGIGGGGGKTSGGGGCITINGGTVIATGGTGAAGIGGGANGAGTSRIGDRTITITGGNVTANGGKYGAGIGGGNQGAGSCDGGSINIIAGTVTATGGNDAAGIGGGKNGAGGNITISGTADVTARGGNAGGNGGGGAGIGGGYYSNGGTINITGGNRVEATGGSDSAGIGGGYQGAGGTINISGGTVIATGYEDGAGIGGGSYGAGGTITISGTANVTAQGGNSNSGCGAGIGGGGGLSGAGAGGTITISGGTVNATGGTPPSSKHYGAGIGGGGAGNRPGGAGGTITISGGTVTATSGGNGAGIGGGGGEGNSDSGTFTTNANGNAIIKASSIADQSGKTGNTWRGIIFEGSDGGVYGSQTLNSAFEVESGKTLLIAEGATLTTQGKLTNNGAVYVDGTLSGTVSGNAVYYPLTLTDCTANNTSTYSDKTYAKSGDNVTLTADPAPAGKVFDRWTSSNVTIAENSFTMPSKAVTATANFADALTINTQPQSASITYGKQATLSVNVSKHSSLGTAALSYKWYKDSVANDNIINGATSASYTTPTDLPAGDHTYYCVITCGSYTVTSNPATVTVNRADGSVSITSNPGKTYDGTAVSMDGKYTVTGDGTVTVEYTERGKDSYSTTAPKDAGDYTVKVTKAAGTNYTEAYATEDFTIAKREVTVSGITAENKTYDGKNTATLVYTGAVLNGKVGNDDLTVTATGTFTNQNAGTGRTVNITGLTLGGASAGNYSLATTGQQATTTANISPATITGVTLTSASEAYTGSSQSPVISAVNAGTLTLNDTDYTVSYKNSSDEAVTDLTTVGSYKVVVTANENSNFTGSAETGFQIGKATNTWTTAPADTSWTYGDENPTLPTATPKFGTVKVEYRPASGTDDQYSETVPTDAGSYKVRFTVDGTDNYTGLSAEKDLTIGKKTIGIQWGSTTFTYSGSEQCPTATATGLVGNDTCVITVTGEQTNVGDNHTATAESLDNGNYQLPSDKTTTFTISPKTVTVTAGTYEVSKVYDGTTAAGTPSGALTVTGILDADSGVTVNATPGAYTGPNVGGQSTVVVSLALNGTGSANYRLAADTVNVPCTITAKPITISTASATDRDYVEGDTSVEADVIFDNAVGTLTKGTDYTVAGEMTDANAGTGKTVDVTVTLRNGNYALADNTTTTTVTIDRIAYPGAPAVSGSAMYGNTGRMDLSNYLADGYVIGTITKTNGDIFTGAPGMDGTALTFSFANVPGNVGQTAVITVPVTGATNYDPYSIAVTVTVEAKTVPTVTAPTAAAALIYSGEAQTLISAGTTTGGEMQYSLTSGTGYSTELPTAVNAGDYTVYYKVVGSSDYADVAENSLTVTIGKKEVTATPKDVTITRGSAIPAFELIYTGLLGEDTLTPSTDPTFTCFEADGTTSVSTRTAAGTYTITWTNTDIFDDETNYRVVAAPGTLTINNPSYSGGSSTPSYSVTVPKTENGTITVSPKSASRGGTVTITVTPDDGYTLETLTATDAKGNKITLTDKGSGKYTFQMPDSKVTVEATFVPVETEPQPCDGGVTCPAYHFTDVDTSAWYHEAVDYVLLNGLMSGYGGGLFGPNDSLSRAQLAQILYNREGQPTTGSGGVFTDVAGDAWYSDAVTWANLSGIVEGYGNGRFGPNDPITREQLAVMLYHYAQFKGYDVSVGENTNILSYKDFDEISEWAIPALQWAAGDGVMNGYDGLLNPKGSATRAEAAQMLKNFLEHISK